MRTTFDLKKYTHTNHLLGGSEKKKEPIVHTGMLVLHCKVTVSGTCAHTRLYRLLRGNKCTFVCMKKSVY